MILKSRREGLTLAARASSAVALVPLGLLGGGQSAFARTGEDPVGIITRLANQLFAHFGPLNGASQSFGSRRALIREVVESRFDYADMVAVATQAAANDLTASERSQLEGLGRDLVVEFLLSFFVRYNPNYQFVVQGARASRSGNRTLLMTSLQASSTNFDIRWDIVDKGGRCVVFDVRVLGVSLIADVQADAYGAYLEGGTQNMISTLEDKRDKFLRLRPN